MFDREVETEAQKSGEWQEGKCTGQHNSEDLTVPLEKWHKQGHILSTVHECTGSKHKRIETRVHNNLTRSTQYGEIVHTSGELQWTHTGF